MKWEYRTIKAKIKCFSGSCSEKSEYDKFINELGEQEWELVSVQGNITYSLGGYPYTQEIILFFKRPLSE